MGSPTKNPNHIANSIQSENNFAHIYIEVDTKIGIEVDEEYPCSNCHKTFSNIIALRNHKRVQHFLIEDEPESVKPILICDSEPISHPNTILRHIQNDRANDCLQLAPASILNIASEDISYIMVKIRDSSKIPNKSSKRTDKEDSPVDKRKKSLTGPFKCMQAVPILTSQVPCGETFYICCEYSKHFFEKHSRKRRSIPICQVCEKPLDQSVIPGIITQSNVHTCSLCGQVFLEKFLLDDHMRRHQRPKPFECKMCSKKFSQSSSLQQHMRLHSGDRPYKCIYCKKAFTQKAGLQQHLRTHTNFKPFECVICSKKFTQSIHLKQHMRTHTNITPFECQVCSKKFKQPSHLNFHLKAHVNDFLKLSNEQRSKLTDLLSKEVKFGGCVPVDLNDSSHTRLVDNNYL